MARVDFVRGAPVVPEDDAERARDLRGCQRKPAAVRAEEQVDPILSDELPDALAEHPRIAAVVFAEQLDGPRLLRLDPNARSGIRVTHVAAKRFRDLPPERRVAAAERRCDSEPDRAAHGAGLGSPSRAQ